MRWRLPVALCVSALPLAVAACGGGGKEPERRPASDRLVDPSKTPFVNSLEVDSKTGDFLLTTNKGFWRIDPDTDKVTPVRGTITAGSKSDTVGTFLFLLQTEDGRFIGSGHPDHQDRLPQFLGFIESADQGRHWKVISRLAEADLHKIVLAHGKMYAFDAVLGAMLISSDGGRTFEEKFTPRGLIIDFVVDPEDPNHLLAATEDALHSTRDAGDAWRPAGQAEAARLAWPAKDALYRAVKDGTVERSADGGSTWRKVGEVPGEPYKIEAVGPEHLYIALGDGTIVETEDGGGSFEAVFRP